MGALESETCWWDIWIKYIMEVYFLGYLYSIKDVLHTDLNITQIHYDKRFCSDSDCVMMS
jgi:hypothetical protein